MSFIANDLVKFEEYEIHRARWQLSWRDEPLQLNRKTFDLLLYLIDHRERVVGKDELLQALWPEQFIEESNLTQHIFLLRKALSRHESGTKIIETVPGRGYRFAAVVREQLPTTDRMVIRSTESITRITLEEEETDTVGPALRGYKSGLLRSPLSRKWLISRIAGATVAAVALCMAGWSARQRWFDRTGGLPIGVVLTALGGTTGDAVLDKSLTQALRMDLAQSPYVSVVPTATVQETLIQMMHKPYDTMNPAMAREVCERTNSQSVLSGDIAKVGQHFLITEEASSCVDGSVVATAKYEAKRPEDLPHGIDTIAANLRQKLGESRRSIARFSTPLFPVNTGSLEALKDFSQATHLSEQGRWADAIALLKQAIAADPNFATAYGDLARDYIANGDSPNGRAFLLKAYGLRDSMNEPDRFAISELYNSYSTEDLFEAERNDRNWTELYPNSVQAWTRLSIVQRELGHHVAATESAKHALALAPNNQALYDNLAYAQVNAGKIQEARATCDRAIARNLDGDRIRNTYLDVALLLNDPGLLQSLRNWGAAHPEALFFHITEMESAIGEGRFSDAHRLLAQVATSFRQQGLPDVADSVTKEEGINLFEAGDRESGAHLFKSVAPDPESGADLVALAEMGDFEAARADLHAMHLKYPQGTLWNLYWGPRIESAIAILNHKPLEAIALLEPTRPLDNRGLDSRLVRGNAYLAAREPASAEKEFQDAVAHHELDPDLGDYALSWLGLGRALAAEDKRTAAIDAYQHFLTLWAHADPDAKFLQQAKQELAALQKPAAAK